jgi:hypothetical protein
MKGFERSYRPDETCGEKEIPNQFLHGVLIKTKDANRRQLKPVTVYHRGREETLTLSWSYWRADVS